MRCKTVTAAEVARHGGLLSAEHYVPNPEPVRRRIANLERQRASVEAQLATLRELLARLESGVACTDPSHNPREGEGRE